MSLSITSAITPTTPVVTAASVKSILHLNHSGDDTDITNWIYAAGRLFERFTGLSAQSTTYLYTLDRGHCDHHHTGYLLSRYDLFSPLFTLNGYSGCNQRLIVPMPRRPVTSVTTVQYRDSEGTWQTVSSGDYTLDSDRIVFPPDLRLWQDVGSVLSFAFVAGASTLDPLAYAAIRAQVAYWYLHRASYEEKNLQPMPGGWEAICQTFRGYR